MRMKTLFKKTYFFGKEHVTLLQVENYHPEEALALAAVNISGELYFRSGLCSVLEGVSVPRAHPMRHIHECFGKYFFSGLH